MSTAKRKASDSRAAVYSRDPISTSGVLPGFGVALAGESGHGQTHSGPSWAKKRRAAPKGERGRFVEMTAEQLLAGYLAQVQKSDGCWMWTGRTANGGHGRAGRWSGARTTDVPAHHVAWMLEHGSWPARGAVVRHRCDTPACVNPAHLELGTHADNVADRVSRGRSAIGERAGRAVLTEADARAVLASAERITHLARRYGVDPATIRAIRQGRTWRHLKAA